MLYQSGPSSRKRLHKAPVPCPRPRIRQHPGDDTQRTGFRAGSTDEVFTCMS